ncbi:MAG: SDR family oxidoreductase [Sedimenticola sp.]
MRILITGATGFIGSHITQAMIKAGHHVILCVRNPATAQQRFQVAECIQVDFTQEQEVVIWVPRLKNIDIVINAVGIIREHGMQTFDALHRDAPTVLFQACEIAQVKRVIQISALGADETALSQYHLSKRAADEALSQLKLEWAVLMPSIVYGSNAKSMALFKAVASLPVIPLVDAGDQPVQPIHISDLMVAVLDCVETKQPIQKRIELVGPEPITMRELYSRLRNWLGFAQPRFAAIPYSITLLFARWTGFLTKRPISEEAVQMLKRGNTGDVGNFVNTYGYLPKSFDQALSETPAQQADRWHAGLYFLRPLLRWSIAFVWIFTGIISVFVVPTEVSFTLLTKAGVTGLFAPLILYGASATDILIGLAVLTRHRPRLVGWLQITVIILYTLIITASQPEQWIHPFGPVTKNIPMIASILVMMTLEKNDD